MTASAILPRGVHPDDFPALVAADKECFSGEAERSIIEYRIAMGKGWRWMYSNAVAVARGSDGRATKLIGAQMDITDLREARDALALSEARFRMVLEDAPVGMAVMNEMGLFTGVNAALATLSGYEVAEMRHKMRLADLLSRRDFVKLSRDFRALHQSDGPGTYQNQYQLRSRNGELRWGLFNLNWTFDKNLQENVYIAQIVDITDQKRVEKIKSEFVATVSHELRTPLTSIKGALGLLSVTSAQTLPTASHRLLDIASLNVDRLTAIVNDILDLEKISSGDVAFEIERIALEQVVLDSVAHMESFARDHHNRIKFDCANSGIYVHADAGRLRQVLENLLSNACKFSDPDTSINVRCAVRENHALIEIGNTGRPIPDRFQSKIFDAFTQADGSDTRSAGGTGLGLNIAQQIVRRLGGQIGFERMPDNKTVFWFTCPLAEAISPSGENGSLPHVFMPLNDVPRILFIGHNTILAAQIGAGLEGLAELEHAGTADQAAHEFGLARVEMALFGDDVEAPDRVFLIDQLTEQHPNIVLVNLSDHKLSLLDPRIYDLGGISRLGVEQLVFRLKDIIIGAAPERKREAS